MPEVIRKPAVAGSFYPASAPELDALVASLLAGARAHVYAPSARPKAVIAPHAGYVYSGPIAASAFALLLPFADTISRVVVVGPAHRAYVEGVVSPGATRLETPLGPIDVDTGAIAEIPADARAHAREHSIEVELPFVQKVAPRARVVPLAVGHASPTSVAQVLRALWGGDETVVVVSSDLSHYLPYAAGREADRATAARVVALDGALSGDEACGAAGINGLLVLAREKGMRAEVVDLRSSGDTAGPRDEVVGYGAFAFYEEAAS
jgi:AmmeMemoRadiSam system protein B